MSRDTDKKKFIMGEIAKHSDDYPTKSLARTIYNKHPEWFRDVEHARGSIRYYRGASGEKDRKSTRNHTTTRAPRKAGQKLVGPPPSSVEPWEPFEVDGVNRIVSLSDVHFPYHDLEALETAVGYTKKFKPTIVLLNGDICDFYSISRWEKHPAKRNFKKEIDTIVQGLTWLRQTFPKARFIFKAGNHEERYNAFIWAKAPELWDIPQCRMESVLGLDNLGIEWVEDERPIMAGKLPVFHGHELPRGLTNPVNQARGAFLRTNASTLTAHGHQTSSQPHYTWDKQEAFSWSQGCLCELHPKYARINKYNHGFATIEVSEDGTYEVTNLRVQDKIVRRG